MLTRLELEQRLILLTLVGSRLYGTDIEDSDYDYKGVCIAPKDFYLGLNKKPFYLEEINQTFKDNEPCLYDVISNTDTKVLELTKFIGLLLTCNPNSLDLLWVPSYVYLNPVAKDLIKHRDKFLSKRVKNSYSQYAKSQVALAIRLGGPCGYKPKPMSHAIRLYTMALEILKDEKVIVDRRGVDSDFLRDIRLGNIPLNYIKDYVIELEEYIEEAFLCTKLQEEPDIDFISNLQVNLLERYLY